MATTTRRSELGSRLERIDEMVQRLEDVTDPVIRATSKELVQSLLALHGAALERVVEMMDEAGMPGQSLLDKLGRDELVRCVLVLHGLHPVDVETRVRDALEKSRPYLKSHGGNVELVDIDEGETVRLRMQGSCHGCPSSALTLKMAIEDAIREAAPEVVNIMVMDAEPAAVAPLPLVTLTRGSRSNGASDIEAAWEEFDGVDRVAITGIDVVNVSGQDVLFCRHGESVFAYAATCASCLQELGSAHLGDGMLTCAKCGTVYDIVKAGRGVTQPAYHLEPFPLLVEHGHARIALPLARAASA